MVCVLYSESNGPSLSPGLSLTTGCRRNSPAEKEDIAGWILAGEHSVKGNEQFFVYALAIVQFRIIVL